MSSPRRNRIFAALALALSCALAFVLLELSLGFMVRRDLLGIPAPASAPESVWDADHPTFGSWHRPGASQLLRSPAFEVHYRINSVGARDVERERIDPGSRVVVLGDSVTEGWGVEAPQRLSNLLEKTTRKPHLNLSMAHFSPYQSYLVYREFGGDYSHDMVLLGVFPFNDFTDLDYDSAAHAPGYEYRYRPYLLGRYPDYRHFDHREPGWRRFLRRRSYSYNALDVLLSRARGLETAGYRREMRDETDLYRSFYYDYTQSQLALLKHSIELIRKAAGERPVVVILFPTPMDMLRSQQSGPSRLADEILGVGAAGAGELRVVDLLPRMKEQKAHPKQFFLSIEHGDFHLSPAGNAFAAHVLRLELADLYASLSSADSSAETRGRQP